jgi:cysteine synthase
MNHQKGHEVKTPVPVGTYAQEVFSGEHLWVSGQLGVDPKTGTMVEGDVREQTGHALVIRPSAVGWPALSKGFDLFLSVSDDQAVEAMRLLASVGIAGGESAAAPCAALRFATEDVTDPEFYAREVIGKLAATTAAGGP